MTLYFWLTIFRLFVVKREIEVQMRGFVRMVSVLVRFYVHEKFRFIRSYGDLHSFWKWGWDVLKVCDHDVKWPNGKYLHDACRRYRTLGLGFSLMWLNQSKHGIFHSYQDLLLSELGYYCAPRYSYTVSYCVRLCFRLRLQDCCFLLYYLCRILRFLERQKSRFVQYTDDFHSFL